MDKITIRKTMRKTLDSLSEVEIMKYSKSIDKNLIALDVFKNAESIFLYSSILFEPKTKDLIDICLKQGKSVFLPTIIFNEIYPVRITETTKFYKGKFDILEPFGNVYFGDIDLTIMPMTAFDSKLNRVGKGGGFYDKFLLNRSTYKIGLGYSFMQVDEIETDNRDVKLDLIVTEKGVINEGN